MKTVQELNRLKIANTIINRGSRRLGVKPLYISALEVEPKEKSIFEKPIQLTKLANELKKEKTFKFKAPKKLIPGIYVGLALIVIYALIFVFNPSENKFNTPQIHEINESANLSGLISPDKRALIITSGAFKNYKDAKKLQEKLNIKLGVPMQIVKSSGFYTIQIGPAYDNPEDALVVFDELSRYSIGEVAMRYVN